MHFDGSRELNIKQVTRDRSCSVECFLITFLPSEMDILSGRLKTVFKTNLFPLSYITYNLKRSLWKNWRDRP